MARRVIFIGLGLIVLLCLGGAVLGVMLLLRSPGGGGPPFWQSFLLQREAQAAACRAPASVVPGSYQQGPVQTVGEFLLVTYTAECTQPGRPPEFVQGYVARGGQMGCGGGSSTTAVSTPPPGGPVTIADVGGGSCSGGPRNAGLSIATGSVTGVGVAQVEVTFASGEVVSGPVQNGRFAVAVAQVTAVCVVRALDASGGVLAEHALSGTPGKLPPSGGCP